MRISTSMIFDTAVTNMQSQTSSLMHTQQQITTGNRMATPADDPAAAAQALQVTQAKAVNTQYAASQGSAKSTLSLEDGQLQAAGDLVQYVRDRVVQANNGILTDSDRLSIATDIKAQFDQLAGIANSTDGLGQYLFAGNKSGTLPFANTNISAATALGSTNTVVTYQGDDGQRALQVSASRQLPVNDAGSSLFLGNASAAVTAGTNTVTPGGGPNLGTAAVGDITNSGTYNGHDYTIAFATVTPPAPAAVTYTYTVTDNTLVPPVSSTPAPFIPGTAATPASPPPPAVAVIPAAAAVPSTPISFGGLTVTFTGPTPAPGTAATQGIPADGDTFAVRGGGNTGIFNTLANIYNALSTPTSGNSTTVANIQSQLNSALGDLDATQNKILNTRASVGSRLNEVDALGSANADLNIQYSQILSNLQDTDYTEAISKLSQQQIGLQAAQKSFMQVSNLSLFNYIQ